MVAPVQAGEVLAGKYRVERVLGEGGMGVVVAARHVDLDELVALKFLLPEALTQPEAVARFLKEARAAVRIKSEHVARVHDVGQLAHGEPYIVMEYLDGSDLAALLKAHRVLSIEDALDFVTQACEAIADAHAVGIVHRDLKPSNLMLVRRSDGSPCVKVLDFGISKIASRLSTDSSLHMTRTATSLGSPLYMSPEQMMSARDVDERTDIWALGTILYELLSGSPPFTAETMTALAVLIATTEPAPLASLRPDIPPGLSAVVMRCLAKQRDDRYRTVAELAQALAPFAPERARVSIERAARILSVARDPDRALGRTPPGAFSQAPGAPISLARPLAADSGSRALATPSSGGVAPTPTASNWGQTAPVSSSRRKAATLIGVGVAALAALGVAYALLRPAANPASVTAASALGPASTAPATVASAAAAPPAPAPGAPAVEPTEVSKPEPEVSPVGVSSSSESERARAAPPSSKARHEPPAAAAVRPRTRSPSKAPAAPEAAPRIPTAPAASPAPPPPPTPAKKSAYEDM